MAIFLQYIELHYPEDVTLESLARSANVSKSECLRCFKNTLQTTPYKYLIEYRENFISCKNNNYRFYVEDASGKMVQKEYAGTESKSETEKISPQSTGRLRR